jgi:hypothetical protein
MIERKIPRKNPMDEVLILEAGCSSVDIFPINKSNQSVLYPKVKKLRPKRSNSATKIETEFMPSFYVTIKSTGQRIQIFDDNDYWLQLYAKKFKARVRHPRMPFFWGRIITTDGKLTPLNKVYIENIDIDFESYKLYSNAVKNYGLNNRPSRPDMVAIGALQEFLRLLDLEEKKFDFDSKQFLEIKE